jgi:hypothetical protein
MSARSGIIPLDNIPTFGHDSNVAIDCSMGDQNRTEEHEMSSEVRTTDAKGRLSLPKGYANATVVIEEVSDTEIRIRKAVVVPEDEVRFMEEYSAPLSNRDRDIFLKLLDDPPPLNDALRKAMRKYLKSK